MQTFVYPIELETSTDGGFVVSCRDLPGVWVWMKRRRDVCSTLNTEPKCQLWSRITVTVLIAVTV